MCAVSWLCTIVAVAASAQLLEADGGGETVSAAGGETAVAKVVGGGNGSHGRAGRGQSGSQQTPWPPALASFVAQGFTMHVAADCSSWLADHLGPTGDRVPFALLYNRVSDSRESNLQSCAGAVLLPGGVPGVRIAAANDYGHVDIGVESSPAHPWLTLRVVATAGWNNLEDRHLAFGLWWRGLINESAPQSPLVMGKLQGPRALRGLAKPAGASAGFVTVTNSSYYRYIFNAAPGAEVGFVYGATAGIDAAWRSFGASRGVLAASENPHRFSSWYWSDEGITEANADACVDGFFPCLSINLLLFSNCPPAPLRQASYRIYMCLPRTHRSPPPNLTECPRVAREGTL